MTKTGHPFDQIVYVLQGGGALGAYQAGVCEALIERHSLPDWIIGTSIGAINGSIIAGNKPENRIKKLNEFWDRISTPLFSFGNYEENSFMQAYENILYAQWIALYGQPNFFRPRLINPWFLTHTTPDKISLYDTSELKETLESVIDFDILNKCHIRLTLGAVRIKGGKAVRFDNTHHTLSVEHIMASCALPPGFPAVKINGEYFWDGGLSSNTPFAVVLEEKVPQKLLCYIVNLFSYPEHLPSSLIDVYKSKKDIQYASRHQEVLHYFCELHYLQHTVDLLQKTIVAHNNDIDVALKRIKEMGHPTSLNIIRFHYQDISSDMWSKDFNFSLAAIKRHWNRGYKDANKAFEKPEWIDLVTDETGVALHEF